MPVLPSVSAGRNERCDSPSSLISTADTAATVSVTTIDRADHAPELRERQRELRQAREHEARARDVHDHARHERQIERRAGQTPAVAERGHDEHRREDGGNFGDHDGSSLVGGLRGSRRQQCARKFARIRRRGGTDARTVSRVLGSRATAGRIRSSSIARSVSRASRSATRCPIRISRCSTAPSRSGSTTASRRAPRLTFVRPGLARLRARAAPRSASSSRTQHLADNEFNSRRLRGSDRVRRSRCSKRARFRPAYWDPQNVAACGTFFEFTLPAESLDVSTQFWQTLGFGVLAAGEAPHRWQRLGGHGIDIGLHETHCVPGLSFRCRRRRGPQRVSAREGREAARRHAARGHAQASATLTAPEGTVLYLLESGAQ